MGIFSRLTEAEGFTGIFVIGCLLIAGSVGFFAYKLYQIFYG